MKISQAAQQAGCSPRMVRYYEQHGLLDAHRLSNGYRDYSAQDVERLRGIVALSEAGLTVESIKQVLPCTQSDPREGLSIYACPAARHQLEQQLDSIKQRIATLTQNAHAIEQTLLNLEPLPPRN